MQFIKIFILFWIITITSCAAGTKLGAGGQYFKDGNIWIGMLFTIAAWIIWFVVRARSTSKKERALIENTNKTHGTNFSYTDKNLGFGSLGGTAIYFDTDRKKICIASQNSATVVDYSYIKSWQLNWTEQSKNGHLSIKDVHFIINTTDLSRPTIYVGGLTKRHGEDWNNRLSLILGN